MPVKNRELKKTRKRVMGDSPENLVCLCAGFESNPAGTTATRGSPSCNERKKKMEGESVGQQHRSHHVDCSEKKRKRDKETQTPSKKSSFWFFIPFDDHDHGYQKVPTEKVIDRDDIWPRECHTMIGLTSFPSEQSQGKPDFEKTELPSMRFNCQRTVSESSSDSDDSSICFVDENDVHEGSFVWIESDVSHDDSFICFEDDGDGDEVEDEDMDDDDDDDDDDDSSTSDAVDDSNAEYPDCSPMEVEVNESTFYESCTLSESEQSPSEESSKKKKKKKVSFVDSSELVTVHSIVAWDYAYRAARVSQWMEMARDAMRFRNRIQSLEAILSPILSPKHRACIWESRMMTDE